MSRWLEEFAVTRQRRPARAPAQVLGRATQLGLETACRSARVLLRDSAMATALLLIDVVNPLDFDGGDELLRHARIAARKIRSLQERARSSGVPSIYVNDNFDCWHLGFREIVERVREGDGPGRALLDDVTPDVDRDYFVLKPMHSGFFQTSLEVLLRRLEIRRLVLTGFAGDICVLFTAADAHMRGFELAVPSDCTASMRAADNEHALEQMRRMMDADTRPSSELGFGRESQVGSKRWA